MSTSLDDVASLDAYFREAVAAIDAGDVGALQRLTTTPALVRDQLALPGA